MLPANLWNEEPVGISLRLFAYLHVHAGYYCD